MERFKPKKIDEEYYVAKYLLVSYIYDKYLRTRGTAIFVDSMDIVRKFHLANYSRKRIAMRITKLMVKLCKLGLAQAHKPSGHRTFIISRKDVPKVLNTLIDL